MGFSRLTAPDAGPPLGPQGNKKAQGLKILGRLWLLFGVNSGVHQDADCLA